MHTLRVSIFCSVLALATTLTGAEPSALLDLWPGTPPGDEAGAIGRRYRRQDEAGTPFGVTVDFDTLGEKGPELEDTVTLRHRDTMKQERVKIADLPALLLQHVR